MDIAKRVREAREALSYTQEELAAEVGVGREAVVNIEGGKRGVKVEELCDIARVLQRPLSFFLEDEPPRSLAVSARGATAARREVKRAELWLQRRLGDYGALLRLLGVRDQAGPVLAPTGLEGATAVAQAQAAATAQRRHFGLDAEAIPDVRRFLEDQVGVPVFGREVADPDFCGLLLFEEDAPLAAVLVRSNLVASRRNFTMAHEYGHLVWKVARHDYTADVFYRRLQQTEEERFANAFAAHLLAPDQALKAEAEQAENGLADGDTVMRIGAKFGLSFEAITYRLQNVGLVSAEQARRLRNTVSPSSLPSYAHEYQAFEHQSPMFRWRVIEAYCQQLTTVSRAAEMLGVTSMEFADLLDGIDSDLVEPEEWVEASA
ncbi:MAG: ImmA/IrrE family metallo-endopeptidase [Armatimonadota bacterium]